MSNPHPMSILQEKASSANEASAKKAEGLSPFGGVNKADVQRINDLAKEYERTKDAKLRERITTAKLEAVKKAVEGELANYLASHGVTREKLEAEYQKIKIAAEKGEMSDATLNDDLGFVLLSFLEHYAKLGEKIAAQRPVEKAAVTAETEKKASKLKTEVQEAVTYPVKDTSSGISRTDDKKNAARETANASDKASGKNEKKHMTASEKAEVTHRYVTEKLIASLESSGAKELLQEIHDSKDPKKTEELVVRLQTSMSIKPADGAFGRHTLKAMLEIIGETGITERKPEKKTASKDKQKQASGPQSMQEVVNAMTAAELQDQRKAVMETVYGPNFASFPEESKKILQEELAMIEHRIMRNEAYAVQKTKAPKLDEYAYGVEWRGVLASLHANPADQMERARLEGRRDAMLDYMNERAAASSVDNDSRLVANAKPKAGSKA